MVINILRKKYRRADTSGHVWSYGQNRQSFIGMRRYRVLLDGRDATEGTYYVDSRRGIIRQWIFTEFGDTSIERRGRVRHVRREGAPTMRPYGMPTSPKGVRRRDMRDLKRAMVNGISSQASD